MDLTSLVRAAAVMAFVALAGCSEVGWRHYETSDAAEVQREIIGRITVRLDGIVMSECSVCLNPRRFYNRACVTLDASGLFHKEAPRSYAWLQDVECRTEDGGKIRHDFEFPFYLADARGENLAHYLGDILVELTSDGGATVTVTDDVHGFLDAWEKHGQPPLKLKIARSLLKLQDNTWAEKRKTEKP